MMLLPINYLTFHPASRTDLRFSTKKANITRWIIWKFWCRIPKPSGRLKSPAIRKSKSKSSNCFGPISKSWRSWCMRWLKIKTRLSGNVLLQDNSFRHYQLRPADHSLTSPPSRQTESKIHGCLNVESLNCFPRPFPSWLSISKRVFLGDEIPGVSN